MEPMRVQGISLVAGSAGQTGAVVKSPEIGAIAAPCDTLDSTASSPDAHLHVSRSGMRMAMTSASSAQSVSGASILFKEGIRDASMQQLWDCKVPGSSEGMLYPAPDGKLYCTGKDGTITAVKNGEEIWNVHLSEKNLSLPIQAPDGTLYVAGKEKVYMIKDGVMEGEYSINDGQERLSRPAIGLDGTVFVTASPGKIHAFKNGKQKWSYSARNLLNIKCKSQWSEPAVGPDGAVCAADGMGHIVGVRDGQEIWSSKMAKVYVMGYDADSSGNERDKSLTGPPLFGDDGVLYAGSEQGVVYAIKDGKELWNSRIHDSIHTMSVGPGGTVYARGADFTGNGTGDSLCVVSGGDIQRRHRGNGSDNFRMSPSSVRDDGSVLIRRNDSLCTLSWNSDGKAEVEELYREPHDHNRKKQGLAGSPVIDSNGIFYTATAGDSVKAFSFAAPDAASDGIMQDEQEMAGVEEQDNWLIVDGVRISRKNEGLNL